MMNRILLLVVICVALAALKAVALLIVALLALAVVVAFIMHPRHTVIFVVTLTLSATVMAQPLACIGVALVAVVALASYRRRRRRLHQRAMHIAGERPS